MITARTAKQKWALAIWNKMNEIAVEKGEQPQDEDFGRIFVARNSDRITTLAELESKFNERKSELLKIRAEKAAIAYFETEEGKARKEAIDAAREKLQQERIQQRDAHQNNIREIVTNILGSTWGIERFGGDCLTIGMRDTEHEDQFVFANEIDITYNEVWKYKDEVLRQEEFKFNIGSTGSFDVLGEDLVSRAQFYIGVGKLLADKEALAAIKAEMVANSKESDEFQEKMRAYKKELENPLAN